jgi:hypothetical protein
MRNLNVKSAVWLLVIISGIIWFLLSCLYKLDLSKAENFFGLIPKVVTIDLLIGMAFAKWGWKLEIFREWLVRVPNLNGSWVGAIHSDWTNPSTGKKLAPIPVMLTVKQSLFHICCLMHTGEMESISYAEGFLIEPDKQMKGIAYSYTSKPRLAVRERSNPHDGSAVFKIIEKPKKKLVGRYWTERLTKGEIELEFHSKDLLEELPEGIGNHPATETNNRH